MEDTYINRIASQVFKEKKFTSNNCLFVVAVVDLIFDVNVETTTLTGEAITKRMGKLNSEKVFNNFHLSSVSNLFNILTKLVHLMFKQESSNNQEDEGTGNDQEQTNCDDDEEEEYYE